jgi:hypothetical protein
MSIQHSLVADAVSVKRKNRLECPHKAFLIFYFSKTAQQIKFSVTIWLALSQDVLSKRSLFLEDETFTHGDVYCNMQFLLSDALFSSFVTWRFRLVVVGKTDDKYHSEVFF